jgi:hypothetical protein
MPRRHQSHGGLPVTSLPLVTAVSSTTPKNAKNRSRVSPSSLTTTPLVHLGDELAGF